MYPIKACTLIYLGDQMSVFMLVIEPIASLHPDWDCSGVPNSQTRLIICAVTKKGTSIITCGVKLLIHS